MEPKFQSSFIPKGPLATSGSLSSVKTKDKTVLGVIASAIFGIAVIAALGVFAYNIYLGYSIKKIGAQLDTARSEIDQDSITELTDLNARILSTQSLLAQHVILSPLFSFLENSTLKTVRFTDFHYGTDNNILTLSMKGQARGYSAVSLQSDIFSKSKYLKNVIFSDLNLDEAGNVTFAVKFTIDPSLVSYKREIDSAGAVPVTTTVVVPSASSTATSTATTTATGTKTATSTSINKTASTTSSGKATQ